MSWTTPRLGIPGLRKALASLVIAACAGASGCTAIVSPIDAIPADRLPPQFLAAPRANKVPIDMARLRQEPPAEYLLDKGDILGIVIESILGVEGEPPPVHFPEVGSDLPPAIGFPTPVREDGTIALPLVPAIPVGGLNLTQARELIRKAYMDDQNILVEDRIIVTLIKERTVRVTVVRSDGQGGVNNQWLQQQQSQTGALRSDQSSQGFVLDLPAYKNDVLQALAETGGLPGVNAKNEIKIYRGNQRNFRERDLFVQQFYREHYCKPDQCYCPPPLPEDPTILRIPLRLNPGEIPTFTQDDIILNEGDIVVIESRETEVFYAGGLLPGGEFQIPRDYDLDVLGAVALVGGRIGAGQMGGGGGLSVQGIGGAPPSELILLRKLPCNQQIAISIDLTKAINDPSTRLLVQPGDTLILRYKPVEELVNFGLGTFFTFGIRELFN